MLARRSGEEACLLIGSRLGACRVGARRPARAQPPGAPRPAAASQRPSQRPRSLPSTGDDEEIERFWKELGLTEKGKVLVKGMFS